MNESKRIINTYLTTQGLFMTGHLAFRALTTLTYIHIFKVTLAEMAIFLGLVQILILVFEIPTGVVGDTIGRKHSFRLGNYLYALAALIIALTVFQSKLIPIGILALTVIDALAWTFQSGSLQAWLTHNLKLKNYDGEFHQIFASALMLRSGTGIILGPIFVLIFYYSYSLPWFFAIFLFVLSNLFLSIMTKNLEDHEVDEKHENPIKDTLQKAKNIINVSYRSYKNSPHLKAWTAIMISIVLTCTVFNRFYPVWIEQFQNGATYFGTHFSVEELVSYCYFMYLVSSFFGSWFAKSFSFQRDKKKLVFLTASLFTIIPFLLLFLDVQPQIQIILFITMITLVTIAAYFIFTVASGQFNEHIQEDNARNTLNSAFSFCFEGFCGLAIFSWGLFAKGLNIDVLFKLLPIVAIILFTYGFRVVLKDVKQTVQ